MKKNSRGLLKGFKEPRLDGSPKEIEEKYADEKIYSIKDANLLVEEVRAQVLEEIEKVIDENKVKRKNMSDRFPEEEYINVKVIRKIIGGELLISTNEN